MTIDSRPSPPRGRGAAVAVVAAVLALLAVAAADRLLARIVPTAWLARSLVFPPNVRFAMRSPEFDCEVRTNELGLRGGPVPPALPGRARIAVIGDSFTYGWGVDVAESWPAVLERLLRERGIPVDVLNLGSPGAGPNEYADVAERALPVLRPSLVVVGLLQGDDLLQSGDVASAPTGRAPKTFLSAAASRLFPTLVALLSSARERSRRADDEAEILEALEQTFRDGAADLRKAFTPEETRRYESLPANVRSMFESGGINPALVALAMRRPAYFMEAVDGNPVALAIHAQAMQKALERLRTAADSAGARVVVAGIPYPLYVSEAAQENLRALGFRAEASALTSEAPDRTAANAARAAGLDMIVATGPLRAESRTRRFYFPWDNHFTAEGHAFFAARVADRVAALLAPGGAGTGAGATGSAATPSGTAAGTR